ncbi:MAG: cytochrome c [Sedimenticola sp.]|uniref:Cytochrome c n=1 Tax=Sedimenticola thiotaurini TaxID=1543721 RepID=A0A558D302_9GAMM|nr:cytochrome c [Sedimenticola sp.]MCW8946690.1 cytochrome c [Sedimenticola sp.]MCW8949840.1 cytochrome c [Sedimenticola sp.]MDF1529330.1 cytochrome c [Sedimenticola sp.]TVT55398.1 MAG: cytochrome c [Sedimenticola thiotaurini]
MNKRTIKFSLVSCLIGSLCYGSALIASESTQGAIDFRESVMTTFKWYLQPMGAMTKGDMPFDATLFKSRAEGLANATRLDVTEGFPLGSAEDTEAQPKIWDDWDDFKLKYEALQKEATELQRVASSGDEAAMKAQFGKTAKTCGGCHKEYRKKK